MVSLQWLKQHKWFKNEWCVTAAPFIGLFIVIFGLVAVGTIHWTGSEIVISSPVDFYKGLLTGLFGGAAGPIGYDLQKGLPDTARIFKPGPDEPPKV